MPIVEGNNVRRKEGAKDTRPSMFQRRRAACDQLGDEIVGFAIAVWDNLDAKVVEVQGDRIHVTGKEYQIPELLALRKGATLTKEMFVNHLYGGMDEPELKIIDVFVCKLRKKLASASGGKDYIETIWGRGYVLREPTEQSLAS
jgi:DNA-binding response OmpR family regulator